MNKTVLLGFSLLSCLLMSPVFTSLAQQTPIPTVWIKIHRIQAVDGIEGVLEDGADWHYYIWVWNGEKWLAVNDTASSNQDDVVVDATHTFEIQTTTPTVEIALLEDDLATASDVADISAHVGGGYDNYDGTIPRGAKYRATFDLTNNELAGDETIPEGGYLKTSGDYDDSIEVDENDANLWFDIWDNYEFPVADAGPDQTVRSGDKVNFDGSGSTASEGSYTVTYEWDFENDGVFDEEGKITSHTYPGSGEYQVVLKVTDNLGQSDTDICIINVQNREPTVSFTYSPSTPTIQDTINFEDTSEDTDGSITAWFWEFGDGTTSTEHNPTHQYADKGNYTVTLTVTDNEDATNTTTVAVSIYNLAPTANFTYSPTQPTIGEDIEFTDGSTDPEGELTSWSWDFGDGYTSTARNPTHKYNTSGTYSVTLTVTDDEGATDTTSQTVTIKQAPVYTEPWFFAVVGVAIIAIIATTVLAWKKRK